MWTTYRQLNFWRGIQISGMGLFLWLLSGWLGWAQQMPRSPSTLAGGWQGGLLHPAELRRNWLPPVAPIFQLQHGHYDYGRAPLGYGNYWADGYLTSGDLDYSWMRSQAASQPLAFVLRWKDAIPGFKTVLSFSGSSKLKAGMSEEDVTAIVGVPLQRFASGEGEIWKYSAFRLVFEGGQLKGYQ
jgi:hypothetical protein